jgi:hypothetical protein
VTVETCRRKYNLNKCGRHKNLSYRDDVNRCCKQTEGLLKTVSAGEYLYLRGRKLRKEGENLRIGCFCD